MRVGVVILPEHRWREARYIWRSVEELGFHHAWTYDHLNWRDLRESPWYSAIPTLTAAAVITHRIRLGTLVATPNFRHPVTLAKEVAALDDIAGGRFTLGLGAGAAGYDRVILGQDLDSPRAAADRFTEFVAVMDAVLRTPVTRHDGPQYTVHDLHMIPGPTQLPRIPFAIAGSGPRGMDLAVRHAATWVTNGDPACVDDPDPRRRMAAVRAQVARLDERCERAGRPPRDVGRLVDIGRVADRPLASVSRFTEVMAEFHDLGFTDVVVHYPRPAGVFAGNPAMFEQIAREVLPELNCSKAVDDRLMDARDVADRTNTAGF